MSYRDIKLLPAYETGLNDLIEEFYIPVLEKAKRYDRIAGFFSSSSLALSARGIAGLIENQGKMRLITCPRLEAQDFEVIKDSVENENTVEQIMCKEIDSIADSFQKDHVAALGWLLNQKILEMKIAFVYENGSLVNDENALSRSIMHQKVGVLYDDEYNGISFSGSNNESASGWLNNIEEFKVFCSWNAGQKPYFDSDREKFERLWNGNHPSVVIKDLPRAVAEKLIEISKDFQVDKINARQYALRKKVVRIEKPQKEELSLFFYQKDAVEKWKSNNRHLLLEMATGCGKTRTAIGCMKTVLDEHIKPLLIIVACPGNTLSVQWKTDIDKLNVYIEQALICDGTNSKWKTDLDVLLKKLATRMYNNAIVFTTHQTCSSKEYISMLKRYSTKIRTFFIGDEVHGMGAYKTQQGLLDEYEMRLGLSATPSRWFDESGTQLIQSFFGNDSFEFTIESALNTINPITGKPFLVNYHYHPRFVHLTDEELEKYKRLSDRIIKMAGTKDSDKQQIMEYLLFQRANIEKSAENKYAELDSILTEIGSDIDDTIIFASPDQIQTVLQMLAKRNIAAHSFTEAESTKPSSQYGGVSERDFIISHFKKKNYKVLVAIKCLDEGIDIPSAKRAIVMASSTNPREYVQRIGRVIRQAENKQNADIYDMIIKPDLSNSFSEEFRKLEQRIFQKEMDRVLDLSKNSLDNASVVNLIYKIKGEFKK